MTDVSKLDPRVPLMEPVPDPVPFGKQPAFPQQVRAGDLFAVDAPGLNISQHVWLTLFAAYLPNLSANMAAEWADVALPVALERLEGLA